jgi:hypothetical protein
MTTKNVTTLYHSRTYQIISARLFYFPNLKIKLKGLHFVDVSEVQETVTDELKKVQKEKFSAGFQKMYFGPKTCIYANGAYSE